jgi:hypothetical protein
MRQSVRVRLLRMWLAATAGVLPAASARAADPAVEEIVAVLRARGLIDDAEQTRILAVNAASAKPSTVTDDSATMLAGLELMGDVRVRWEDFAFDGSREDAKPDFSRLRVRLRIGAWKALSERFAFGWRLASNIGDPRSMNVTLGDRLNFEPIEVRIDQAFLRYTAPELASGLQTRIDAGRLPNPFRWDLESDVVVWDPDISLEGVVLRSVLGDPDQRWFGAQGGAFYVSERDEHADSMVYAGQLIGGLPLARSVALQMRASLYGYRSFTGDVLATSFASGNLSNAFHDSDANVGEAALSVRFGDSQRWPLVVWGEVARNFTAESGVVSTTEGIERVGPEQDAWMAGVQLGDLRRTALFATGLFRVHANAVIAQFTDSDYFDSQTNVRGYYFLAARELLPGVRVRAWMSKTHSVKNRTGETGSFGDSFADRDRFRYQLDLMLGF